MQSVRVVLSLSKDGGLELPEHNELNIMNTAMYEAYQGSFCEKVRGGCFFFLLKIKAVLRIKKELVFIFHCSRLT